MAGYILPVAVTEIFLLFNRHKTYIIFKKNLKKKTEVLKTLTRDHPYFSIRQPSLLPPKPLVQLLIFPTFQYLYTALELKPSQILTLTLWLNCSPSVHSVFIHGFRIETVPKPNPTLMASAALELKPSLTLTLTLWPVRP